MAALYLGKASIINMLKVPRVMFLFGAFIYIYIYIYYCLFNYLEENSLLGVNNEIHVFHVTCFQTKNKLAPCQIFRRMG